MDRVHEVDFAVPSPGEIDMLQSVAAPVAAEFAGWAIGTVLSATLRAHHEQTGIGRVVVPPVEAGDWLPRPNPSCTDRRSTRWPRPPLFV